MQKLSPQFEVRPLDSGDAAGLLAFYLALDPQAAYFFTPWPLTLEAMNAHLRQAETGRAISLGAIRAEHRIVGHAFIKNIRCRGWRRLIAAIRPSAGRPRVGIGLSAEVRGHGLGRMLMSRLLSEAGHQGLKAVCLGVHKVNVAARALYEDFGFRVTSEFSQQERNDSLEMEARLMD